MYEEDEKTTPVPDKKPRKKRSDAGKPKPKARTVDAIKSEILDLVDEAVELTRNQARVSWE